MRLMNTLLTPGAALALSCLLSACVAPSSAVDQPFAGNEPQTSGPLEVCTVATPAGMTSFRVVPDGVVFALATAPTEGANVEGTVLERTAGVGCELTPELPLVAAAELLDVDDDGNLYVVPAEAATAEVVSTMIPDEFVGVSKVDRAGRVSKFLQGNRGIWSFGMAPRGDALWITACGPTGIFVVTSDGIAPAMAPPNTRWEQGANVLTDAHTFFSVGTPTCTPSETGEERCIDPLVRSTAAGDSPLGDALPGLSDGSVSPTLSRCGANVCAASARGVVVWGADGSVLHTVTLEDARGTDDEHIAEVGGNRFGLYLELRGGDTQRLVFVPMPGAS